MSILWERIRSMKILITHPQFYMYGGAERQIVHLANYLTDHNQEVSIASGAFVPEILRDTKEARLLLSNNPGTLTRMFSYKFDVLNPHNHPAELYHIPLHEKVVWQCNEPSTEVLLFGKVMEDEMSLVRQYIDKVSVIDEFNAKRFKDLYGMDAVVNYPGVRYEYFSEDIVPQDRYDLEGQFVVLQSGYLTWTKNQVATVEQFAKARETIGTNSKLILTGYDKDPYTLQVKSKIADLGLKNDVILTGYLDKDDDIRNLYNLADIFVSPLFEQGGWANALEAVSAGIPTIVSERMTCSSLFKEHELGLVSKIEDFHKGIVDAYQGKAWKQDKEWIRDNLTWDKFGERMLKIFEEVIS